METSNDGFLKTYRFRFPPMMDGSVGVVYQVKGNAELYRPMSDLFGEDDVVECERLVVARDGISLWTRLGVVRYEPEGWPGVFTDVGLTGSYENLNSIFALEAMSVALSRRRKKRGQRGPTVVHGDARNFLVCAVLVRCARGETIRKSVPAVLAEYEDTPAMVPWPFASAEETLRKLVTRWSRAARTSG